tara:strand:+ start:7540 stop:7746 length:207 start_codon:yes stop_codon:yes gene_type:complete
MTIPQILITLGVALGRLDAGWRAESGHTKDGSFTVIRYDGTLKKGQLRRMHALIEDVLSEHLGEGDRV